MSKKARSEGNRVASLIKANKAEYYIADVDLEDDSNDVVAAVDVTIKTLGKAKCTFMLISAGNEVLTVVVNSESGEWLNEACKNIEGERNNGPNFITIKTTSAFKLKDIVRANGFEYLKRMGCIGDDDSSEEYGLDM